MKKLLLITLLVTALPNCSKKQPYSLFKESKTQTPTKQIAIETTTEQNKIPELDFEVQNATGKTLFIACFTYIQKEKFTQWRWDKSPVYKLTPNASTFINIDTIPDNDYRSDIFGYLAIFENEQEANESIYELVDDNKKIDLDRISELTGKKVVVTVKKYGFRPAHLDFAIVSKEKKRLPPELDFAIENQTGKMLFVTGFMYEIKESTRSVWNYEKTPVLKLEPGQTAMIDIDTIARKRDRIYMSGFLGVFEEHEEKEANEATYELLPPKNKLSLGRLSRIQGQKVILEVERYGSVSDINEFAIKPTASPLENIEAEAPTGVNL
ncbi:hypothetical protein KKA53_04075 [Candidatus Dependentiae bacterium]|nr:hypothetical protein [Candidatus Dependentiae bacterium]